MSGRDDGSRLVLGQSALAYDRTDDRMVCPGDDLRNRRTRGRRMAVAAIRLISYGLCSPGDGCPRARRLVDFGLPGWILGGTWFRWRIAFAARARPVVLRGGSLHLQPPRVAGADLGLACNRSAGAGQG